MPTGIGTGIGALFSALGKRKLADAQMDIYGQRLRSQMAQQAAATALDDSKTNLNNTQLGGMTNYGPALLAAGVDPKIEAVMAAAGQGNRFANLNTTNEGLGRAFLLGGIGDPQVNNTVAGIDNTKVGGGVAFNPTLAPGAVGQTFQNVGATDANVAAAFARAAASKAAAGASGARATLLGTQNTALLHPDQVPGAAFNKPSPSGASMKLPVGVDPKTVAFARGKMQAGATPEQVYRFLMNSAHAKEAQFLFGGDPSLTMPLGDAASDGGN